jgi:hypothetical protein
MQVGEMIDTSMEIWDRDHFLPAANVEATFTWSLYSHYYIGCEEATINAGVTLVKGKTKYP